MSSQHAEILVCLNDPERDSFLPEPLAREINDLPQRSLWLPPPGSTEELVELLNTTGATVLVGCWSMPPLPPERSDIPSLQYLCYLAGDTRAKLPSSLVAQGLRHSNWGPTAGPIVAECALMLTLMCLRRAGYWNNAMHHEGAWKDYERVDTLSLYSRRVGVHGFGSVARGLLPLLAPFGCEVRAFSQGPPDSLFSRHGVSRASSLEELTSWADVFIEAEIHDERTEGTVREEHLTQLGNGVFVNVARGELVPEADLLKVASRGELWIGLDVFHHEPLPVDSPLRGMRNVCLLPHLAGPTTDRRCDSGRYALEQLKTFFNPLDPHERLSASPFSIPEGASAALPSLHHNTRDYARGTARRHPGSGHAGHAALPPVG